MTRTLTATPERFPIAGAFVISRGAKTEACVVHVNITQDGAAGQGECVPYARYGETEESVLAQIEDVRPAIENGMDRYALLDALPAGAARNAVDCALWDLEAKRSGRGAHYDICAMPPVPVTTAFTISMNDTATMADHARVASHRPLIKVKVGGDGDHARLHAVAGAATTSRFIIDANEAWTPDNISEHLLSALQYRVVLVEQPLPVGQDEILRSVPHPVPICADESVHTIDDLEKLVGLYDVVNIKLDKTGGLTAALMMMKRAHELGFGVMVGCMVGTSLAMAPAVLLAQSADFVDLDGPLLLKRDRQPGLRYAGSLVSPPDAELWG
ncbi:N-acetyl-D-Glu racemase DgcA [Notoacmeibacter sp. MSK16QG-6]|uniref:N-acetyl-D-Glu racemase DgcA n=1 Tax=Notoacmeibacter sp. MSK16QG-6 TaxID=2957982 RepID=UPI00209F6752|nr:N-acetyl-D-Glu racemase DgcA [Notoacmeibacter sp. MSK16QG-6]MCP1197917.1 dipeptide epimerase [Notoacmeibacter sp. MSK16QG-6]